MGSNDPPEQGKWKDSNKFLHPASDFFLYFNECLIDRYLISTSFC